MPNKDQIKGRAAVVLGTLYFMVGKLTGNLKLQAKGKAYQVIGKPLARYGDFRDDAEGTMPRIDPQALGGGPPPIAHVRENTQPARGQGNSPPASQRDR